MYKSKRKYLYYRKVILQTFMFINYYSIVRDSIQDHKDFKRPNNNIQLKSYFDILVLSVKFVILTLSFPVKIVLNFYSCQSLFCYKHHLMYISFTVLNRLLFRYERQSYRILCFSIISVAYRIFLVINYYNICVLFFNFQSLVLHKLLYLYKCN